MKRHYWKKNSSGIRLEIVPSIFREHYWDVFDIRYECVFLVGESQIPTSPLLQSQFIQEMVLSFHTITFCYMKPSQFHLQLYVWTELGMWNILSPRHSRCTSISWNINQKGLLPIGTLDFRFITLLLRVWKVSTLRQLISGRAETGPCYSERSFSCRVKRRVFYRWQM